jgi:hypothetical protein
MFRSEGMRQGGVPSGVGANWSLIDLPVVRDNRGNLTFIEGTRQVPFKIERVYYLYDVPSGSERAGHAHKALWQLIIAASGSFSVHLEDGTRKEEVFLNRSHVGLLMGPMVWRVIDNFSSGAVCLVLASSVFDEADYIRDYATFLNTVPVH